MVVGIGAGWREPEYVATGIPYDRPGIPIERMLESIAILRGLFADGPFSFQGRYYTITDMDGGPKPGPAPASAVPHRRHAGEGPPDRRAEGDIVGLDLRQQGEAILDAFEARTDERIGWIRDEIGDRLAGKDVNVLRAIGDLAVTNQPLKVAADVARDLATRTGVEISARDILDSPFSLIGTVPDLVGKLRSLRQRWGINSFLVGWFDEPTIRDIAPVIEQLSGT